jgi:chromosome segregation protein
VHLRSLRLRGFKSFPDTLELKLEPGVAVVVGPNGSGKSNVADAIVWAAGSLTPSELRAEKPDDVLFNGAEGRTPAESCEVELVFDNESGGFGELDFSEVSIARRLHRGGEGQYLVNKAQVRRTDLVELLADVGLSGSMHSIVSQGKVEAVLASKPEERRELVEEAAGLGKFKRRRHRAELKLARVGIQVERARDVEAEVRKRLRPLALQATAAERAEKLVDEIAGLRARIAQLDLEAADARREAAEERKTAAGIGRRSAQDRLQALLTKRQAAEEELADAAGRREGAIKALYRLQGASERIALRHEGVRELLVRLRTDVAQAPGEEQVPVAGEAPDDDLERAANEAAAAARAAARARDDLAERAVLATERLSLLERSLAEREGIPPAARAFADEGATLALSLIDVEPGGERAVAAALGWRASAVVASDPAAGFELLRRARDEGLGSLAVLVGSEPAARVAELPVVSLDELLAAAVPSVTIEGFGFDPVRGELWFAGEAAEAVLLELETRRRALDAEVAALRRRAADAAEAAVAATEAAAAAESAFAASAQRRSDDARLGGRERRVDARILRRVLAAAERLDDTLAAAATLAQRLDAPLRARVDAGASRTSELGAALRELGAAEVELRRSAEEAAQRATEIEIELTRIEAEAADARRRLEEADAEPAEGDERDELAARADRLEQRRIQLGQVNPLAKEEYEAEKERLTELEAQREDLEQSLKELADLRDELAETVERRFADTFHAVAEHFEEVAATLFPGGEGRLRLVAPDEEGGEPAGEIGVEVELRPAGKKITRLGMLSGGEKALGAISFLFALFLAKPCPFYLLDEVEAALDDTNIGRFVELLRRYADRAQFVVITHQKRTMEAADVLYGVTMGNDGVSQIVSRRLPREDAAAVAS